MAGGHAIWDCYCWEAHTIGNERGLETAFERGENDTLCYFIKDSNGVSCEFDAILYRLVILRTSESSHGRNDTFFAKTSLAN